MIKKVLGIIPIVTGAIALLLSFEKTKNLIPIQLPLNLSKDILFYVGCALLLIGAFLLFGDKKTKKIKEVPIYEGERIVGYRRI